MQKFSNDNDRDLKKIKFYNYTYIIFLFVGFVFLMAVDWKIMVGVCFVALGVKYDSLQEILKEFVKLRCNIIDSYVNDIREEEE